VKDTRTRVLYIAGWGRSGSTLLDRLLGDMPVYFSLGEFRHAWARSYKNNELCGCGKPFRSCIFWSGVRDELEPDLDPEEKACLQRLCNRGLAGPELLRSWFLVETGRATPSRHADSLLRLLGKMYSTIARHSGAGILVDSSKSAPYARIIAHVPGIDLRVLHVVRDSRAVAFSRKRKRRRPEIHWERAYMPTFSVWWSACEWMAGNSLAQAVPVGTRSIPYCRLRYEDFAQDPRAVLQRTLQSLELPDQLDDVFVDESRIELASAHTVSGNPMRFKSGPLDIYHDDEWQGRMPSADRRIVSALTWPLLIRYGYPLRAPRGEHGSSNQDPDENP